MPYINKTIVIILSLIPITLIAQNNFNTLGESALALNYKVSKKYSTYFAFTSRSFLYRDSNVNYEQLQLNIIHFSTLKLGYSSNISFGVNYRNRIWFETGSDELRFTEQFNCTKKRSSARYGHRFRAEQRILSTKTIFRQRYRFAIDFPLNGEKLDVGEAYLVNAIESLLSLCEAQKPETDLRLSTQIGWQVIETLKLQIGLEYRLESFNTETKNNLFVLSSAILKI